MKVVAAIAVVVVVTAYVGASSSCKLPPRLQCASEKIASQCQVYDECFGSEAPQEEYSKVSVALYYEAMCPGCQGFLTCQLLSTYQSVGEIMNITLVPFGNAEEKKVGDKWVFECQHGKDECDGNILETCAISILKEQDYILFIYCLESAFSVPLAAAEMCADVAMIDLDPIMKCYNGSQGNKLEHEMAMKTNALKPPHQYTPWIVINGVHSDKLNDEAQKNLLKLVCNTYKGPKPKACADDGLMNVSWRDNALRF